jgi:cytochrome b561
MGTLRYAPSLIALHWVMLGLIVVVYACMELRGFFPRGSEPRELMKAIHFSGGLSVLLLVIARLALRFRNGRPPITPPLSPMATASAAAGHLALYVFMVAMPVMGWLLLSAEGAAISFWGLPVPALVAPDDGFAEQIEGWHELGATLGYWLVGLHAAAGLAHHYLRRDDTLRRILPGRGRA